mmetsp:Transcript_5560/g.15750  ORF Transcript_5560/g.15750 Transcript_5560/m.15750 type:complete len:179 (+) Transcript_5560:94-630(+)
MAMFGGLLRAGLGAVVRQSTWVTPCCYGGRPTLGTQSMGGGRAYFSTDEDEELTYAQRNALLLETLQRDLDSGSISKKKLQKLKKLTRTYPPPPVGVEDSVGLFLWKIGGECYEHKDSFEDFHHLMSSTGSDLKVLDIPVKQRRLILRFQEKYRQGEFILYSKEDDYQVHEGARPPDE